MLRLLDASPAAEAGVEAAVLVALRDQRATAAGALHSVPSSASMRSNSTIRSFACEEQSMYQPFAPTPPGFASAWASCRILLAIVAALPSRPDSPSSREARGSIGCAFDDCTIADAWSMAFGPFCSAGLFCAAPERFYGNSLLGAQPTSASQSGQHRGQSQDRSQLTAPAPPSPVERSAPSCPAPTASGE